MTEEDTFRALQRPTLHEMIDLWSDWTKNLDIHMVTVSAYSGTRDKFFKKYNWSWREFFNQRTEYLLSKHDNI